MNIFKSKLNFQNPIKYSNAVLKHITTITAMSALLAACGDHCVGGFKGYNHDRCMQEKEDETINTNNELEQTQSLEENTEEPELGVVQHIGHACSEPDDNEIAKDFLSQEFKDSCETETRCENNDHGCDSSTCQIQDNTFNICLTASHDNSIIYSNGVWFNISCLNSNLQNAPSCQITIGETLRLLEEYNYQCEDDYKFNMEARHVVFFTKDLLSNKTICDSNTESCFTTATYSRISSTMPDELYEICPSHNYGHCHAQDVTVTLEEKADGERTYCLQATLNN